MRCLFLQGKYMIYCTAVKEGYIPSPFELDEFCRQEKHKACPFYRKAEKGEKFDVVRGHRSGNESGLLIR